MFRLLFLGFSSSYAGDLLLVSNNPRRFPAAGKGQIVCHIWVFESLKEVNQPWLPGLFISRGPGAPRVYNIAPVRDKSIWPRQHSEISKHLPQQKTNMGNVPQVGPTEPAEIAMKIATAVPQRYIIYLLLSRHFISPFCSSLNEWGTCPYTFLQLSQIHSQSGLLSISFNARLLENLNRDLHLDLLLGMTKKAESQSK